MMEDILPDDFRLASHSTMSASNPTAIAPFFTHSDVVVSNLRGRTFPAEACKGFRRNKRPDNRRGRNADGYRTNYPIVGKVDLEERLI